MVGDPDVQKNDMTLASSVTMTTLPHKDDSSSHLDSLPPLAVDRLPAPIKILDASCRGMVDCARQEIQALLRKEQEAVLALTPEEEDALDDGFCICDAAVIRRKLAAWHQIMPGVKPFYALKCHPDPVVAAVLAQSGMAGFDCASVPEIQLARRSLAEQCNVLDPERWIVYANPQRAEKDLDQAYHHLHVDMLTFDGPEELAKVHRSWRRLVEAAAVASPESSPPPPPQLILRILVPDEHSTVPLGEKFGAFPSSWQSLVELAVELAMPVIGVSFHCGSGNHDPAAYAEAIRLAEEALQVLKDVQGPGVPVWLLDLGGGYPGLDGQGGDLGRFSGRLSDVALFDDDSGADETATAIAKTVMPLLKDLFPPEKQIQVIAEPGRYFVEGAFCLCSRIYRLTVDADAIGPARRHYYIAQGVQGVFKDCLLCNETFTPTPLVLEDKSEDRDTRQLVPSTVHGPSGEDFDIIWEGDLQKLNVGDWLLFDRMGAYTLSIAARNGKPVVRYVLGGRGEQVET